MRVITGSLPTIKKAAKTVKAHIDNIVTYARHRITNALGEAINGKIRALLHRGRGYRDHEYLLLKVQKATAEGRRSLRAA